MDTSQMVKVVLPLGSDHPSGVERERVWATPLPDGTYRIENSPFHANGVSYGDAVYADLDSGDLVFSEVARRGGHSTYRVRLPRGKGHAYFMEFWPKLERLGCTYERTGDERPIYALDLSPDVSVHDVYAVLTALEKAAVCDFEEGHYFGSSAHQVERFERAASRLSARPRSSMALTMQRRPLGVDPLHFRSDIDASVLKSYRFTIEGGFVALEGLAGRYGFYTTIYARAGSTRRALDQATGILKERMHKHGVIERSAAPLRTVYVVDDVSEVTAEAGIEYEGKDTGFTFFSITAFATIYHRVRYSLIRRFRPHLVFGIHDE